MNLIPFICICSFAIVSAEENPQIEISDGKLKGSYMKTKEGRQIIAFQGIPYAQPPLGVLRFKPPIAVVPWEGVVDASKPHAICPQRDIFKIPMGLPEGDENCLYINVYKPKLSSKNDVLLPVMVFIHGGAFLCGSGNSLFYGPETLLDRDVILVTLNYRLGALGFLSTGDDVSPGNNGLKDQSLALKWVQNNIKDFGGNPHEVTIFGESAGAASSSYHMFSPLSKGLFKRVISQSGNALNRWALDQIGENVKNSKRLAEFLNCPTSPSKELIECLRNIDPLVLVEQDVKFMEWNVDPTILFKPVVEPPSPEAFLLDSPANLLQAGNFEDVPWLLGITKEEGVIRAAGYEAVPQFFDDLSEDFNNKVKLTLEIVTDNMEYVGDRIRKFYFGDEKKLTLENAMAPLINMYSDGLFTKNLDEAARIHLKVSKQPLYNYLFAYESEISLSVMFGASRPLGVCHVDDLMYLFPLADGAFPNRIASEDDKKVTKLMTALWANFAKTGNPTPETDDLIKTKWEPMKSEKLEYYHIDANVQEMKEALFEERVKFWRKLPLLRGTPTRKDEL